MVCVGYAYLVVALVSYDYIRIIITVGIVSVLVCTKCTRYCNDLMQMAIASKCSNRIVSYI